MERIVASLQDLIDRHRKDLSILLMGKYGIDEPATPRLLLALHKLHGKEFLYELSQVTSAPSDLVHVEGYEDEPWLGGEQNEKRADLGKLFEFVTNVATTIAGSKTTTTSTARPATSNTKKIIIVGAIVLVVLIVIAIVVRKKS